MAGRGRGATLPAWMTAPAGAPGASGQAGAGLPTASNPHADPGMCGCHFQACATKADLDAKAAVLGPTYSPEVLDAAQAQVLQEQDLAMQQALATHRFAFEQSSICILYCNCIAAGVLTAWHSNSGWSALVMQWTSLQ